MQTISAEVLAALVVAQLMRVQAALELLVKEIMAALPK
jgi:hypothetical protein